MVLAGLAAGFAYLAKEESFLLLPIFFIFLVASARNRAWFGRKKKRPCPSPDGVRCVARCLQAVSGKVAARH